MKTFRREDVVGKTVIETSGGVKGKVKDVVFDLSGNITFIIQDIDGKDSQVTISKVTGISDHVVVKSEGEATTAGNSTTCKYCGASKAPGATWCPSCGRSQS